MWAAAEKTSGSGRRVRVNHEHVVSTVWDAIHKAVVGEHAAHVLAVAVEKVFVNSLDVVGADVNAKHMAAAERDADDM